MAGTPGEGEEADELLAASAAPTTRMTAKPTSMTTSPLRSRCPVPPTEPRDPDRSDCSRFLDALSAGQHRTPTPRRSRGRREREDEAVDLEAPGRAAGPLPTRRTPARRRSQTRFQRPRRRAQASSFPSPAAARSGRDRAQSGAHGKLRLPARRTRQQQARDVHARDEQHMPTAAISTSSGPAPRRRSCRRWAPC